MTNPVLPPEVNGDLVTATEPWSNCETKIRMEHTGSSHKWCVKSNFTTTASYYTADGLRNLAYALLKTATILDERNAK